jgi:hypothetical protein
MPLQHSLRHFSSFFQSPVGSLAGPAAAEHRRQVSQQSGLAELMLLNRLRARIRHDLTADTLARAAVVIGVTARQWFGETGCSTLAREPGA